MGQTTETGQLTLKERILQLPDYAVIFRSDYPEYHAEFVGSVLAELTKEGVLLKAAQGIYVKPVQSRFGPASPSVGEIVQAIAARDCAQVMPCGETALNALGLSTQVPMVYCYLTSGSKRTIKMKNATIILKTAVPRYFSYETKLIAMLVQALKALGEENVEDEELSQIAMLLANEPDREALDRDVLRMPAWMKRMLKGLM